MTCPRDCQLPWVGWELANGPVSLQVESSFFELGAGAMIVYSTITMILEVVSPNLLTKHLKRLAFKSERVSKYNV